MNASLCLCVALCAPGLAQTASWEFVALSGSQGASQHCGVTVPGTYVFPMTGGLPLLGTAHILGSPVVTSQNNPCSVSNTYRCDFVFGFHHLQAQLPLPFPNNMVNGFVFPTADVQLGAIPPNNLIWEAGLAIPSRPELVGTVLYCQAAHTWRSLHDGLRAIISPALKITVGA